MSRIKTYPPPTCPKCGAQMKLKRPKDGQSWEPFWGCSEFPDCKGTVNIDEDGNPEVDEWGK